PRKNAVAKSGRHFGESAARTRGTSSAATVGRFRLGSLNLGSSSRFTGFGPIHQPTDRIEATAYRRWQYARRWFSVEGESAPMFEFSSAGRAAAAPPSRS